MAGDVISFLNHSCLALLRLTGIPMCGTSFYKSRTVRRWDERYSRVYRCR